MQLDMFRESINMRQAGMVGQAFNIILGRQRQEDLRV